MFSHMHTYLDLDVKSGSCCKFFPPERGTRMGRRTEEPFSRSRKGSIQACRKLACIFLFPYFFLPPPGTPTRMRKHVVRINKQWLIVTGPADALNCPRIASPIMSQPSASGSVQGANEPRMKKSNNQCVSSASVKEEVGASPTPEVT